MRQEEDMLSAGLINSSEKTAAYGPTPARFYVLFAFCLLSFNQCLFWITFTPIASNAKLYYGIGDDVVALLLNWGPIIYIPVCFVTSWLTAQKNGLRRVCVGSAVVTGVFMVVRCIPSFRHGHKDTIGPLSLLDFVCLHSAQIVNAAVGPPVMASPSLLSAQWFPDNERNRATAVAILANNLGAAIGFVLPGWLNVRSPSAVPILLYAEAGLAVATMLLVLAYFPAAPYRQPSRSAMLKQNEPPPPFFSGLLNCMKNPHFFILAMAGGALNGVFNTWSGSFDQILPPLDPVASCAAHPSGMSHTLANGTVVVDLPPCQIYTQDSCGWIGFVATIAVIVGGFIGGSIADSYLSPRKMMKAFIVAMSVLMVLAMAYFTFALPSALLETPPVPSTPVAIVGGIVAAALFMGAATPLFYELGVEMTYPVRLEIEPAA